MLGPTDPRRPSSHRPSSPPSSDGATAADAVESNRSLLNPLDAQVLLGRMAGGGMTEQTTLGEFLQEYLGFDLDAPAVPQLHRFVEMNTENADPLIKMRNVAENRHVRPGAGVAAERVLTRAAAAGGGDRAPAAPPAGGVGALLGGGMR